MVYEIIDYGNDLSAILRLRDRLGPCCVALYYGTVLEDAVAYLIGYYEVAWETGSKVVP